MKNTEKFKIIGLTEGFTDSTMLYLDNVEKDIIADSALIINNKFTFTGHVTSPQQFVIRSKNYSNYKFLWIENSEITLRCKKGDFRNAQVTGSKIQAQSDVLETKLLPGRNEIQKIQMAFRNIDRTDTDKINALRAKIDSLRKIEDQIYHDYIYDNPSYLNSALMLTFLMFRQDKEETRKLYQNFSDDIKSSKYGRTIKDFLELSHDFEIGDKAEDFTLNNLEGKPVSLSDYSGKYVLLEFWSSGCGGCYYENKNLVKYYNEYKHKGFNILSVSLDKNKEKWKKGIERDSLIWENVSDLEGHGGKLL